MLKIYTARADKKILNFENMAVRIGNDRYEKACRYKILQDKALSLTASLLLCRAADDLNLSVPPKVEYGKYGKPDFAESKFHFSISHSNGAVAVAVSDCPVGVDIQNTSGEKNRILTAKKFFCENEYRDVAASKNSSERFFDYWTLKEAFVKADGRGFSLLPKQFEIVPDGEKIEVFENGKKICCRFFLTTLYDDYRLASCNMSEKGIKPEIIQLNWMCD